LETYKITIVN